MSIIIVIVMIRIFFKLCEHAEREGKIHLLYVTIYTMSRIYMLMRDEKEERKKQARSNKQQSKATQHTQGSPIHDM